MKKYEVSFEGVTVDFRKALAGTNDYNENFCNSFMNLTYVAALPLSRKGVVAGVNDTCLQELYSRAFNYCAKKLQLSLHHCTGLAEALKAKIKSYRPAA